MRLNTYLLSIVTMLILIACGETKKKQTSNLNKGISAGTGRLLPIDFADSNYYDLQSYAIDNITADGWSIKYLVKDDSTRYTDIYIECSKGNIKGTFYGGDLLEMRRYFIPELKGETNSNIYLSHGCATDCSAILVFTKDSTATFTDYLAVVDYNIGLGQVLFLTDSTYQNENKLFELALVDIANKKTHKLTLNNICDNVYKPACVDTVIFAKDKVMITTSLRKSIESNNTSKRTSTIQL